MSSDLIDVIEAVYNIEQAEADWVEGVCRAVYSILDAGMGVVITTVDISTGQPLYSCGAALGATLDVVRAVGAAQPDNAADVLRHFLSRPTTSLREVMGARIHEVVPKFHALHSKYRIADALWVGGMNLDGHGLTAAVLLPKRARLSARMRKRWDRIAAHFAAAARLRRRLFPAEARSHFTLRIEGVDALLTLDGRVEHAVGSAQENTAREQLRTAAVALDRARGALRRRDPDRAVALWTALVEGKWSLVDRFESDGRRFLLARRNEIRAPRRGLARRQADVLALRAGGHSIKLIAYELGLPQSVVADALASGMKRLGLHTLADLVRLYAPPSVTNEMAGSAADSRGEREDPD